MDINDLIQIFPPSLAKFCPHLERLEFRWDNDTLRYLNWTRADVHIKHFFSGFQTKTKRQSTSLGQNVWSWSAWWVSNSKPLIWQIHIFQSLCDGKLYEIMRGNFERADRTSVIRTTVNSKVGRHLQVVVVIIKTIHQVSLHYLLANYEELLFG